MTLESIEVKRAEDLPIRVRAENRISTGFVEIRFERHSPLNPIVRPLDGTFSAKLREVMKRENKIGTIFK